MTPVRVPIAYGLPCGSWDWAVVATRFPNANEAVLGGCEIEKDQPQAATVLACPACRSGLESWRKLPAPVRWLRAQAGL